MDAIAFSAPPAMVRIPRATSSGDSAVPFTGLRAGPDALLAWAPAKVNLHLEVLGRRNDGYHALESLMLAVNLYDSLEIRRKNDNQLSLECSSPGMPESAENLVWQAAERLRHEAKHDGGARMRLIKRIPHEAGLGGGSSDAATAVVALNHLWQLDLPREQLHTVCAGIGSDVPFFLDPPLAWCTGRGEIVEPETLDCEFHLVLVKPPFGLSTAAVYRQLSVPASPRDGMAIRTAVRSGDLAAVAKNLHNRLQDAAFTLQPALSVIQQILHDCQPLGCLLCGCGTTLFALCRDRNDARRVADEAREQLAKAVPDCLVFVVRGLSPMAQE